MGEGTPGTTSVDCGGGVTNMNGYLSIVLRSFGIREGGEGGSLNLGSDEAVVHVDCVDRAHSLLDEVIVSGHND
jgi:hypothetical protein